MLVKWNDGNKFNVALHEALLVIFMKCVNKL